MGRYDARCFAFIYRMDGVRVFHRIELALRFYRALDAIVFIHSNGLDPGHAEGSLIWDAPRRQGRSPSKLRVNSDAPLQRPIDEQQDAARSNARQSLPLGRAPCSVVRAADGFGCCVARWLGEKATLTCS